MKCPACSAETAGPEICSACGAALVAMKCRSCSADLKPGVRACSGCGTKVRVATFGAGLVAGVAVALAVAAGFLLTSRGASSDSPAPAPAPVGQPAMPPPSGPAPGAAALPALPPPSGTATPRERADTLFNAVMMASEQGDQAALAQAAPQAIAAYRQLASLDNDGVYHLAALQLANKEFAAARTTAEGLLAKEKGHLLALSVAAQAAAGAGDQGAAKAHYQRLLDAYDAEVVRQLPEYHDHQRMLPGLREAARQALGK